MIRRIVQDWRERTARYPGRTSTVRASRLHAGQVIVSTEDGETVGTKAGRFPVVHSVDVDVDGTLSGCRNHQKHGGVHIVVLLANWHGQLAFRPDEKVTIADSWPAWPIGGGG